MGKKNKKAKSTSADAEVGMPRHVRREILAMTNILLEKCSVPFGSQSTEWNDYLDVFQIVEKLRKKQQNYTLHRVNREEHMEGFLDWLRVNAVNTDFVTVEKYGFSGYGLKALKDIEENDLILSVPRKIMMTTDTAFGSILGPLMKEDRILQSMPNVSMALHVLCEYSLPDSFWQPYLKILPDTYTTSLYFSPDDIQLLKGSPILCDILNQFRNITRQYAYFFRLFQGHPDAAKLPIKNFCYDDYRWAVSTVMTRQNQIPLSTSEDEMDTALIPLWDFCNHTNGQITTDFNDKKDCSECFAIKAFKADEQVSIFYGPRSNAEFLLHNGFIYEDNENDKLAIRMGVSKNDTLYSMKVEVMARIPLNINSVFYLYLDSANPVDSDLLAFLRIFSMDMETLLLYLRGEDTVLRQQQLKDFTKLVSLSNELKVWSFLETRCQILLHAYSTTAEEDSELLEKGGLRDLAKCSVRLRRCEKLILQNVIRFCLEHKLALQQQQQEEEGKVDGRSVENGRCDDCQGDATKKTCSVEDTLKSESNCTDSNEDAGSLAENENTGPIPVNENGGTLAENGHLPETVHLLNEGAKKLDEIIQLDNICVKELIGNSGVEDCRPSEGELGNPAEEEIGANKKLDGSDKQSEDKLSNSVNIV